MKTKHYSLLATALIIVSIVANGKEHGSVQQRIMDSYTSPAFQKDKDSSKGKTLPSANNNASRAQEADKTCQFLEDLKFYTLYSSEELLLGYVSEPAASAIGYMGFKVGDKVKWGSAVDAKMIELYGHDGFVTGTVDLLDSDRCYIVVDNFNVVAVKPYEDIEKLNP